MADEYDGETTFSPTNSSTLSKIHRTTSECWQRTSGTQKKKSNELKKYILYI